ncbi:MAG: hypothetical protein LE168_00310 [Endomicrobium sp.]|nr:hypothetical protein [Endomicrobium sp.]
MKGMGDLVSGGGGGSSGAAVDPAVAAARAAYEELQLLVAKALVGLFAFMYSRDGDNNIVNITNITDIVNAQLATEADVKVRSAVLANEIRPIFYATIDTWNKSKVKKTEERTIVENKIDAELVQYFLSCPNALEKLMRQKTSEGAKARELYGKLYYKELMERNEVFGDHLRPITFSTDHFFYNSATEEFYIPGDCGLEAARRLLYHLDRLGIIKNDAWWKYN